jgi:hypothetical protein
VCVRVCVRVCVCAVVRLCVVTPQRLCARVAAPGDYLTNTVRIVEVLLTLGRRDDARRWYAKVAGRQPTQSDDSNLPTRIAALQTKLRG